MTTEDLINFLKGNDAITDDVVSKAATLMASLEPAEMLTCVSQTVTVCSDDKVLKKRLTDLNVRLVKVESFTGALQRLYTWQKTQPPEAVQALKDAAEASVSPGKSIPVPVVVKPRPTAKTVATASSLASAITRHEEFDSNETALALTSGPPEMAEVFLQYIRDGRAIAARDVNGIVRRMVIDQDIATLTTCEKWKFAVAKHPRLRELK